MARHGSSLAADSSSVLRLAASVIVCLVSRALAFGEAPRFLIASSPSTATIAYVKLPSSGSPATNQAVMRVLTDKGLRTPQGIAVDGYREMLYVADPTLGKLVRYPLKSSTEALAVGTMQTVATNVEARAVAVDGIGNVWFTDEGAQRIMRVTAKMISAGQTTPEIVYSGSTHTEVRSPGGIASDNYFVYWLNKADGQQVGSVIRAKQNPSTGVVLAPTPSPSVSTSGNVSSAGNVSLLDMGLASGPSSGVTGLGYNAEKCYGVCLAQRHAFYTDEFANLYGVPRTASARNEVITISSAFSEPRGCIYDGDSTVYVADKAQNAIYGFAANMENLLPGRSMVKAAELQGPFGVAIFTQLDL